MSSGMRCKNLEQQLHNSLDTSMELTDEKYSNEIELEQLRKKISTQENCIQQANSDLEQEINRSKILLNVQEQKVRDQTQILMDMKDENSSLTRDFKISKQENEKLKDQIMKLESQLKSNKSIELQQKENCNIEAGNYEQNVIKQKESAMQQLNQVTFQAQMEQQRMQNEICNLRQQIWELQIKSKDNQPQQLHQIDTTGNVEQFRMDQKHPQKQQRRSWSEDETIAKTKLRSYIQMKHLPEVEKLMSLQFNLLNSGM